MSVYFAQRLRGGLIKIGHSRSVHLRMNSLSAKLIGAVKGGRKEEKMFHERFAHLRVRGEWFRSGDDLLSFIRTKAQDHSPDSKRRLIQTVVPGDVFFWIQEQAYAEWISVAAYVRRLLLRHREAKRTSVVRRSKRASR